MLKKLFKYFSVVKPLVFYRIVFLHVLLFYGVSLPTESYADKILKEDKIKASYVFNFIRFIQWPTDKLDKNSQPINVCAISNDDHFVEAFRPVVGKKINGHPLILHKISDSNKLSLCHLVYIDNSQKKSINNLLTSVKNNKILTVSDLNSFTKLGGMIGMVNKKGKILVEINLDVAKQAGFHISSNLLEVAKIVSSQ